MVNKDPNFQEPGHDGDEIAGLLAGLKRVNAPGDFDFRVRARIAAGKPATRHWFSSLVRIGAPVAAVMLAGGYFGYGVFYTTNGEIAPRQSAFAPPVTAVLPAAPTEAPVQPSPAQDSQFLAVSNVNTSMPEIGNIKVPPPRQKNIVDQRPSNLEGKGSFEIALGESKSIGPRGINPGVLPAKPKNLDGRALTAREVFSAIGVEAQYSGSSWTVGSVRPNSVGARSGLRPGDVVEAINEQTLSDKTSFPGKFNGRTLRVRRDGQALEMPLRP